MFSEEETRKNLIDSVVNKLAAQKKLLAKNESLPGECYDEAMVHLNTFNCSIEREALKKRVTRAFAKESANPPTPIPTAVAFAQSATNESPSSALSSSIAPGSATTSATTTSDPLNHPLLPIQTVLAILQKSVAVDQRAPAMPSNVPPTKDIRNV